MSFATTAVGSVCRLVNGKAFKPSDWSESGEPIIRIQNLNNNSKPFNRWAGPLEKQVLVAPGDVLFAWSGTPGTSFGGHIWAGPSGVLNQHIFRVDLDETKITREWFVAAINFKLNVLIGQAHGGVGLQHVTRPMIDRLEIPLPPLDEQRRIAAILDQADALRRKRREAITKSETLLRALFEATFGSPHEAIPNWPTMPFGELLSDIESGWSPTCLDRPAESDEWGVLKLGAVTYGRFDEAAQKALPKGVEPRPGIEVRKGDLLFTRKNTYELVAACALVRDTRPRLLLPDLIFRLCLADPTRSHPEYIHALLSHPTKRAEIQSLASGAAGSMPNISKARLRTVPIKLPPPELQARFAEGVKKIEQVRSQSVDHLAQLDTLFASLQHRAFRGEL